LNFWSSHLELDLRTGLLHPEKASKAYIKLKKGRQNISNRYR
jgi:hypothetical protein